MSEDIDDLDIYDELIIEDQTNSAEVKRFGKSVNKIGESPKNTGSVLTYNAETKEIILNFKTALEIYEF